MKKLIIILFIFFLFKENIFSQSNLWISNNIILPQNSSFVSTANYPFFINADVGYTVLCCNSVNNVLLFKTVNSGINWEMISTVSTGFNAGYPLVLQFLNNNTGYVGICNQNTTTCYLKLLKTSNGGYNWQQINITTEFQDETITGLISWKFHFIDITTGYLQLGKKFYKTTNGGLNWNSVYSPTYGILTDFEISKDNQDIYVGGFAQESPKFPILAKSTNAGLNFTTFYNGNSNDELGGIECLSLTETNGVDTLRMGLSRRQESQAFPMIGRLEGNSINIISYLSPPINYRVQDIIFTKNFEGYIILKDYFSPHYLYDKYIRKSTDGGITWINDITFPYSTMNYEFNYFFPVNDVFYLTYRDKNIADDENPLYICTRKVGMHLTIFDDLTRVSGNYNVNNQSVSISVPYTEYYLRGGTNTILNSETIKNSGQQIFYKWNNASVNYYDNHYYFDTQEDIAAHFKTKLKTTASDAISNESQTKCLRDGISGRIHQIHQTMGGIFYSYTSSNGEFYTEEVVNGGSTYVSQFPDDKTAEGNKNPSICEIKWFGNGAPDDDNEYVIAGCWERYDNSSEKTKLYAAIRQGQVTNKWLRYGVNANNYHGVIEEFSSTSSFDSKPDICVAYIPGTINNPNDYFYVIPHLEPSSSGNNLVISAKYKNSVLNDYVTYNMGVEKFTIVENGVDNFAIEGTNYHWDQVNGYGYFDLHIVYEKNNQIIYRREEIRLYPSGELIEREELTNNNYEYIVSANYGESSRTAPDISLKNGKPVVTYRGVKSTQQWVKFEGGGDQMLNITSYPVYVRYKTGENTWGTIHIYNSNSNEFQTKPDVEGSRDAEGYIISFLRGSMFKKFVKLDNQTGYYCNPETYEGTDSKIAKGSYIGLYGQNSNPAILTLSYPQSLLYTVGTQNFIITNNSNPAQDGFSNLSGIIEQENTDYIMTLGPILVSNTITGFDDTGDSLTIQSVYEFNESMTSKAFALSNNDTLILKGYGFHITSPGMQPDPLIYKVDLKYKSNDQLLRELFRDTVQNNDTIDIDYLRGFIITGIQSGTDSFYVTMSVDTATGGDGDYAMGGEYEDESGEGGDNLHGYRTLVIFENSVNNSTGKTIPLTYNLEQNYPNPFNPITKITYEIQKEGLVMMKVYDILGREVKNLVNEVKTAGRYTVLLDGSDLASGVYFYRIESGDFVQVKRMILLK